MSFSTKQKIPVLFFVVFKDDEHVVASGVDGNQYWFDVKKREPIPWNPSDESLQGEESDVDFTEPFGVKLLFYDRFSWLASLRRCTSFEG